MREARPEATADAVGFLALACAITWALDAPMVLALAAHRTPPPIALPLAGLGAFGPALAALVMALRRGVVRQTFGHWRAPLVWIVAGLVAPAAVALLANAIEVALGGQPTRWFYPPDRPEYVAALLVFPLGEELGWRGFAYPRLAAGLGPVAGSLVLGAVWGLWHLAMMFTAEQGAPAPGAVAWTVVELSLWSVPMGWLFEKGGRGLAVAIAVHAGAHLDNVNHAPESDVRLRAIRLAVVAVLALAAARSLRKRRPIEVLAPSPAA